MNRSDTQTARALVGLLLLLLVMDTGTARAQSKAERWVLEFGPYVGFYDFDRLTQYEDFPVFGMRLGARMTQWLRIEGSFDEVYTDRAVSGNSARQVSFGMHARIEPWLWPLAPYALAGTALVILDDSEDPDAFGQALDVGAGLRWSWAPRWMLRGEWVLRRQDFELWRSIADGSGGLELRSEPVSLYGRAFRLGVSYAF